MRNGTEVCYAPRVKVCFSRHSLAKFAMLKRHGFAVTKKEVIGAVKNPDATSNQEPDKIIYQKSISKTHVIRVVTKTRNHEIFIITFYPGRKNRYENRL